MSHAVKINMIADQEIYWNGETYNVYDISSIVVDARGVITGIFLKRVNRLIATADCKGEG